MEDERDSRRRSQAAERLGRLLVEKADRWIRWQVPGGGGKLLEKETYCWKRRLARRKGNRELEEKAALYLGRAMPQWALYL